MIKFRCLNASNTRQFFLIFAFSTKKKFGFEIFHNSFLLVVTQNSKSQMHISLLVLIKKITSFSVQSCGTSPRSGALHFLRSVSSGFLMTI